MDNSEKNLSNLLRQGYHPLRELADKHGYAKDHLGWLIRHGKIPAVRCGNRGEWYALECDVKNYRRLSDNRFSESLGVVPTRAEVKPVLSSVLLQKIEEGSPSAVYPESDRRVEEVSALKAKKPSTMPAYLKAVIAGGFLFAVLFTAHLASENGFKNLSANLSSYLGDGLKIFTSRLFSEKTQTTLDDISRQLSELEKNLQAQPSMSPTPAPAVAADSPPRTVYIYPSATPIKTPPPTSTSKPTPVIPKPATVPSQDLTELLTQLANHELRLNDLSSGVSSLGAGIAALSTRFSNVSGNFVSTGSGPSNVVLQPTVVTARFLSGNNLDYTGNLTQSGTGSNTFSGPVTANYSLASLGTTRLGDSADDLVIIAGTTTFSASASISSNFEVGTNAFYVDSTNKRIGVGTQDLTTAL